MYQKSDNPEISSYFRFFVSFSLSFSSSIRLSSFIFDSATYFPLSFFSFFLSLQIKTNLAVNRRKFLQSARYCKNRSTFTVYASRSVTHFLRKRDLVARRAEFTAFHRRGTSRLALNFVTVQFPGNKPANFLFQVKRIFVSRQERW